MASACILHPEAGLNLKRPWPAARASNATWDLVRGFLFACDQSLVDRERVSRQALKATARSLAELTGLDVRVAAAVAMELAAGQRPELSLVELVETLGLGHEWLGPARLIHAEWRPRPRLRPGVTELFHVLHESHRIAVLTADPSTGPDGSGEGLGFAPFVDLCLTAPRNDAEFPPNPAFFASAAAALGLPPELVAYVASDDGRSFRAARAAGLKTVRILSPERQAECIYELDHPDEILSDVAELIALVPVEDVV